MCQRKSLTPEPVSLRTSTRWRDRSGSWANAASRTAMWSAALLALARPGAASRPALPGAADAVIDEGQHRVKPESALEVRCRALLVRVRADQGGVQVDDHLVSRARSGNGRCHTDRRGPPPAPAGSRRSPRPSHRPAQSMSRLIVASEATGPNNSGWARTTAASATQSPPRAIASGQIQHRLARVVDRTRRSPGLQRR